MPVVKRHQIDTQFCQRQFDSFKSDLPKGIQYVRDHAGRSLSFLASNALDTALYASVVVPREVDAHLRLSGEAGAAMFVAGFAAQRPVAFTIQEEKLKTDDKVDESLLHAGRWLNTFYLAVIAHKAATIDKLCEITAADLKQSSTKNPEYRNLLVDALRHSWQKKEDADKLFLESLKATDPERADLDKVWTLQIDVPLIHSLFYAVSNDKRFSEALLAAVEKHKQRWSKGQKRDDCQGFLALGLTAAACLAKGRGLDVNVESEYIPGYLIGDGFG